ncbi:MAG: SipW-dependent-type signal peptide-containing protein, partial [Peptoniphilus sp.]|nr:SipW-dependent-type signal peptide-containing protein [Peptoniphilus sp.]
MKKTSKALLLGICAVLLITASVLGTMAYLTSQDTVTNTFTVGSVSISLDEKDVDDSTPGEDRDKANKYNLVPGKTYDKDPTIHVANGSEKSYLFVKVENGISAIEGATTVADQMTAKGW